jgi:transcription elongation GreA/GreB family factor
MNSMAMPFDWVQRQTFGAVRQGVSLESLLAKSLIELKFGDSRDVVSPGPAQPAVPQYGAGG